MAFSRFVFNLKKSNTLLNVSSARKFHIISSLKNENSISSEKVFMDSNLSTNRSLIESKISLLTGVQRYLSTSRIRMEKSEVKLSKTEQLKKAVKDYGATVIVFHVTISLASLSFFYVLVSSGIDMQYVMTYFGLDYKFAENAGTFVTAYAIHKLFAPVRISITLGATPFIVKYLRNKGILRKTV